jgi:hypothetical protein
MDSKYSISDKLLYLKEIFLFPIECCLLCTYCCCNLYCNCLCENKFDKYCCNKCKLPFYLNIGG